MTTGTLELPTFEWIVPQFINKLPCNSKFELLSPECHLSDSSWRLKVSNEYGYMGNRYPLTTFYLLRTDSGPSKIFTWKIKSNINTEVATITHDFKRNDVKRVLQINPYDNYGIILLRDLHIICYIQRNTPQQEPTESISRKFTTCAVQTEDANSVIGRENPKDEDWSLLNIKDDTLLRERMKELLTKGIEHDVTICVQDKEFRAHRSILSSRSPVFAMMLTHDSKENNTGKIKIEDCDPESFDEFLLYVYSGRTENLTPTNALRLYYPADKYDFPVLKERCVRILKTSLSVESICDVVLLAAKHQEKELLEVATQFFARNMKKILVTVNWQKFMSQNLVEANELLIKSVDIKDSEK